MGCRPSRRAVACVRVAGEGPWGGSGRSNRPRTLTADNAVKLRHRNSRRSRDEGDGKDEGGNGTSSKDRYSAPPADRQFPPHSCTSAVYEHGCCGTSRITLRLSKNGSTLEIEKCDFQHGVKSCQVCGTSGAQQVEQQYFDASLRAQSAPNLSVTTREYRTGNLPRSSQHSTKQVVSSESHPPPVPVRHMERLSAVAASRMGSPPESVCTATRIDVDVEAVTHNLSSSVCNDSSSYNNAETHSMNVSRQVNSSKSHGRPESLYFSQQSRNYSDDFHSDTHIQDIDNADTYSCPYSPSSEDLSRLLRDADTLLINDYSVDTETVDLTKLESTNPAGIISEIESEDSDIECSSVLDMSFLKAPAEIHRAVETSGNASNDSMDSHLVTETDNAQKIYFYAHDSGDSSFATRDGRNTLCQNDERSYIPGATDYRIRMLGAQKNVITSDLASKGGDRSYHDNTVTHISDGEMILVSCECHGSVSREKNSEVDKELRNDSIEPEEDGSGVYLMNGDELVPLMDVRCKDVETTDVATKQSQCHSKQKKQNCVWEKEGEKTHHLSQRGTTQGAFFYADFENDNIEDVLDNSSSRLESLC